MNRRARFGILVVFVLIGMALVVIAGEGSTAPEEPAVVAAPVTTVLDASRQVASAGSATPEPPGNSPKPQSPIDLFLIGITATTLPLDPIGLIAPPTTLPPGDDTTTTTEQPSTTAAPPTTTEPPPPPPPPPTEPPPPTTLPPPPPTTEPPPPPTTLPPPPPTTEPPPPPPTTTTPPPPPPTTEPPVSWSASVSAEFLCGGDEGNIRWGVGNSSAAWDAGWTLIIDSDSRGVFTPGTAVGSSTAFTIERDLENGAYTLTVNVHWESGGESASYGTFSHTVTVDCDD